MIIEALAQVHAGFPVEWSWKQAWHTRVGAYLCGRWDEQPHAQWVGGGPIAVTSKAGSEEVGPIVGRRTLAGMEAVGTAM